MLVGIVHDATNVLLHLLVTIEVGHVGLTMTRPLPGSRRSNLIPCQGRWNPEDSVDRRNPDRSVRVIDDGQQLVELGALVASERRNVGWINGIDFEVPYKVDLIPTVIELPLQIDPVAKVAAPLVVDVADRPGVLRGAKYQREESEFGVWSPCMALLHGSPLASDIPVSACRAGGGPTRESVAPVRAPALHQPTIELKLA